MKRVVSIILTVCLMVMMAAGCASSDGNGEKSDSTEKADNSEGSGSSSEADWPKKDIQIIVPFSAGGDTDFNARTYAEFLTKKLGVNVVVVNTEGNGGVTGTREMLNAESDGYTVLFTTSAVLFSMVTGAADYTFDDLNVACIAGKRAGDIICVRKDLGVSNMEELVAYTKEHPGELNLAITTGAHSHATGLMLKKAGVDANLVDAGGTSERLAALLGGNIDIIMNPYGGIADYLETGELVAIANPIAETTPYLPEEITTCVSQGFDVANDGYYLFAFPTDTDEAIVSAFAEAVKDICNNDSEYQEMISSSYAQNYYYEDKEDAVKTLQKQLNGYEEFASEF